MNTKAINAANDVMEKQFKVDNFDECNDAFKRSYYRERDEIATIISKHFPEPSVPERELRRLGQQRDAALNHLNRILQWDCLNPPDPLLCADHPWLKREFLELRAIFAPKEGK